MSDIAIKAENLSKLYQLGVIGTGTLRNDLQRFWANIKGEEDPFAKIGTLNDRTQKAESDFVWALKDISFEVKKGEVLGIIGRNGAGKSTLLKILSKITSPTKGKIRIDGRIASLLEVGTGFHPELTGRENIYMNGAILGMRKREIQEKFDQIVDFSGVEAYIDTPVKRYSSGMYVRLAFAVAAFLEPEILIVDEVLAVGDAEFQKKCLGRMKDVSMNEGRTVLFVSHNMDAIQQLCSNVLLMHSGLAADKTNASDCIAKYLNKSFSSNKKDWQGDGALEFPHFKKINALLLGDQPFHELDVQFECGQYGLQNYKEAFIAIDIKNENGTAIMQAIPELKPFIKLGCGDNYIYKARIQLPPLIPGSYSLSFWMGPHNTETYDFVEDVVCINIMQSPTKGRTYPHTPNHGYVVPNSSLYH